MLKDFSGAAALTECTCMGVEHVEYLSLSKTPVRFELVGWEK